MNEKYIRKLIKIVEESEVESLEISSWGRKIKITQRLNSSFNGNSQLPAVTHPVNIPPETTNNPAPQAVNQPAEESQPIADKSKMVAVKSPMVGTFYGAPSPDADPYVGLNEKVRSGQVVCIVEAMKLMNEIETEVSGRIAEILVENGKPVEFGQELFLIVPD